MEYTPMRRRDRELSSDDGLEILRAAQYGILSTTGPQGLPYGTPLSFVLDGRDIVFHCARTGHKITNMAHQPTVCFTAVDDASVQPVYEGDFSTFYRSAVVFGTAEPVEDETEKTRLLRLLCEKYLPDFMDKAAGDIAKSMAVTAVWRIRTDHLTAKSKAKRP